MSLGVIVTISLCILLWEISNPRTIGIYPCDPAAVHKNNNSKEDVSSGFKPEASENHSPNDNQSKNIESDCSAGDLLSARELSAQEGIWRASNVTAFFTALATVIGGSGLYLIWQTLSATRSTLNQAVIAVVSQTETVAAEMLRRRSPYPANP